MLTDLSTRTFRHRGSLRSNIFLGVQRLLIFITTAINRGVNRIIVEFVQINPQISSEMKFGGVYQNYYAIVQNVQWAQNFPKTWLLPPTRRRSEGDVDHTTIQKNLPSPLTSIYTTRLNTAVKSTRTFGPENSRRTNCTVLISATSWNLDLFSFVQLFRLRP